MKKIIFTRPDGGVTILNLSEGARLASQLTLRDGRVLKTDGGRAPVDSILRMWPVKGATPTWAETEDEFAERIKRKDCPANAINPQIVDASSIPTDRSNRDSWRQQGASIVVPAKT